MHTELRQTEFSVEPLRNIVGVGDTTAYQIVVSHGPTLGTLGTTVVPAFAEICNDAQFMDSADRSGSSRKGSWFRRALATLKH